MKLPKFSHVRFALRGVWIALKEETQVQWIILFAMSLWGAAFLRGASEGRLLVLVILFSVTMCAEITNACFERLCDIVSPQYDTRVKDIKDLASGATLVLSCVSFLVWVWVVYNSAPA